MCDVVEAVRAWSHRGPWVLRALKTALMHALLWTGAVGVGGLVGALCIWQGWLAPWLALAFPLTGYAVGQHFYFGRESASFRLAWEQRNWQGMADSALDFIPSLICATAGMYAVAGWYLAMGAL